MIKRALLKIFYKFLRITILNDKILQYFPLNWRTDLLKSLSNINIGYLDYKNQLIKIYVDSGQVLHRLNSCKKEPRTVRWIEDFIENNDVFYDIGANIGAYSFVAYINTSGKCKVYSFEPSFSTYKNLCYNIHLNNFNDRVIPLNIALSDKSGIDEFKYNSIFSGSAEHPGININDDTAQFRKSLIFTQKMFKYSLEDIVTRMKLDLPNHIKIDVDGHEYFVLKGAEKILSNKSIKTIQVEIDINSNDTQKICSLLENNNFDLIQKNQHGNGQIYDYVFKKN